MKFKTGKFYIHPKFTDVKFLVSDKAENDKESILSVMWFNKKGYFLARDMIRIGNKKIKEFKEWKNDS